MWCGSCLKVVGDGIDHTECAWYMWRVQSVEYTKAKLAFAKQMDPDAHKGETVEVRMPERTVNILSFEISNTGWLQSAPNVAEAAAIHAVPKTKKGLNEGPLKIIGEYRGHDFYLENGAILCRSEPSTGGGHGCLSPPDGVENCMILFNDLWFKARVEFV